MTADTWHRKMLAARHGETAARDRADTITTADDLTDPLAGDLRRALRRLALQQAEVWAEAADRYAEFRDSAAAAERAERHGRYAA